MLNKIELPILITGASGFIGSNLLRFFISRDIKVNIILRKKSNIWRIKDIINRAKIFYVDLKEKENHYIKLVEDGEVVLVEKPDGNKYMMVPQNPSDMKYQWDHDDGA